SGGGCTLCISRPPYSLRLEGAFSMADQSTKTIAIQPQMTVRLEPDRPPAHVRAARSLVYRRYPLIGVFILGTVLLLALFGPNIAPKDPNRQDIFARLVPPITYDQ